MIIKDRATMVSLFDWFFPVRILAASRDGTYVLVGRDTVSGLQIVRTDHISSFANFDRLTRSRSSCVLARQHASSALRVRARSSAFLHSCYDCWFAFTERLLTTVHEGLDPSKSGMTHGARVITPWQGQTDCSCCVLECCALLQMQVLL